MNFPGQRVQDEFEIVGVVADTRYKDLRTPDERMAYLPLEQAIDPITSALVAVRGPGDVTRLVPSIRAIVAETVPGGFVTEIATMEQHVEMSLVRERMLALLATFFAALALILACIGLYGVMAYGVARRTREIGIRIAVGASQQTVVWMVARETLLLVTIGAALGTLASLAANRYVAGQLFGVTPRDPVAIGVALSVLGFVTLLAGYVPPATPVASIRSGLAGGGRGEPPKRSTYPGPRPARQASRIDPVRALRTE